MSGQLFHYARSNAELRGMVSRLLSPEQIRALATAPDLEGVLRLLLDTSYHDMAISLLERGAGLAEVERVVVSGLVGSYRRTSRLLGGEVGVLVAEMARRLELNNLKTILRAKVRREPEDVVRPLLVPLGRLTELPVDELLRVEDVEGVGRVLSNSDYGSVLRAALPRFTVEHTLFPIEVALDLHYYRRLWTAVQRLSGADLEVARRMIGIRYDALNIDWLLRYRLEYRLSPEEIFNYTLSYGHRVTDAAIRRAASSEGIEGIVAALPDPYRTLLAGVVNLPDPVEEAELILQRHLVGVARAALSGYPFQIGVALAYLWLKDAEVHDLRAVLEAKRYGRPPETIVSRLWSVA